LVWIVEVMAKILGKPFVGYKGYKIWHEKEGRFYVCLVPLPGVALTRTTITLAKYKLSVKLGRRLTSEEEVDHEDEDKTNDALGNLQILSKQENIAKSNKRNILSYEFECCVCHVNVKLTGKQLGARRDKITPTCSKVCGYKKVAITLTR